MASPMPEASAAEVPEGGPDAVVAAAAVAGPLPPAAAALAWALAAWAGADWAPDAGVMAVEAPGAAPAAGLTAGVGAVIPVTASATPPAAVASPLASGESAAFPPSAAAAAAAVPRRTDTTISPPESFEGSGGVGSALPVRKSFTPAHTSSGMKESGER